MWAAPSLPQLLGFNVYNYTQNPTVPMVPARRSPVAGFPAAGVL